MINIGAYTINSENNTINSAIHTGGMAYGQIYAVLSYGNTVSRKFYNASQTEINSCISSIKLSALPNLIVQIILKI